MPKSTVSEMEMERISIPFSAIKRVICDRRPRSFCTNTEICLTSMAFPPYELGSFLKSTMRFALPVERSMERGSTKVTLQSSPSTVRS